MTESAATARALAFVGEIASVCERCALRHSRTKVVFGAGNPTAELMIVGEAPGADEDTTGLPFVGDAGQTLDTLLEDAGLRRDDTYVTNVVKCRPPGNRPPKQPEVAACAPYLDLQLALVRPRVVLAVGVSATGRLTGLTEPLARLHGVPHAAGRYTVVPMFHPSSFNRGLGRRDQASADVRTARRALDDGGPRRGSRLGGSSFATPVGRPLLPRGAQRRLVLVSDSPNGRPSPAPGQSGTRKRKIDQPRVSRPQRR